MVRFRCRLRTVFLMALIMGLPWFQVARADLNDGLVAYYPFNGNANDESGNGNDGAVNGATLTEDRLGNADSAYSFDGVDDYVLIPEDNLNGVLESSVDFTISMWMNKTPDKTHPILFSLQPPPYSCNGGLEWTFYGNGHSSTDYGFVISDIADCRNIASARGASVTHNEWVFGTIIYKNGNLYVYANGYLLISDEVGDTSWVKPNPSKAGGLVFGTSSHTVNMTGSIHHFTGLIDDIRIYNRALSEDEVKQLYEPDLEPNPVTCSDAPATYSNETRQAILPCVEIPLYTDINGSPLEFIGLHSAVLEIPFGFSDFEAKDLTFLEIIEESNPSHAHFNPDSGILDIPRIDIPTTVPLLGGETVPGPTLQCHATLQQSALRAEVLMLQDFDCNLP
jgi:hypothetical protein